MISLVSPRRALPLLLGACLLTAAAAQSSAAVISDDFTGTYPGGGSGWSAGWNYRHYRTNAPDSKAEYRSANPLGTSSHYLNVRFNYNLTNSGGYSTISRPFDTNVIDNTKAHEVNFAFRLDHATHWNSEGERVAIFASTQDISRRLSYDAVTTNSWGISYDGQDGWTVIESDGAGGIRFVTPSIPFQQPADASTVFNVTLKINPQASTFTVSISDGVRTENWNNASFRFINPNATSSGEHLHFYTHTRRGVQLEYSVADLKLQAIPEPSTVALAGLTLAGLGLRGWLRKP